MAFPRQKAGLAQPFFRGLQANSPRIIQPQAQPVSTASPRQTANHMLAAMTGDMNQIHSAREAAQTLYEQYLTRIRQLEKNSAVELKRIDQRTNNALSQTIGNISSLYNELIQIDSQANSLQRRLEDTQSGFAGERDLDTLLAPLASEFETFGKDFDRSLNDVDRLFENLRARVPGTATPGSVGDITRELAMAQSDHQNNLRALEEIRHDLENGSGNDTHYLIRGLAARIKRLGVRIDALEKKHLFALDQSQNLASDTQTAEFEYRTLLDRSMETLTQSLLTRIQAIRGDIANLAEERASQIVNTHARLAKELRRISKLRTQKLDEDSTPRKSKRPQIEALRRKVAHLKQKLEYKPPIRVFFRFDPNPDVILVLDDGTVFC